MIVVVGSSKIWPTPNLASHLMALISTQAYPDQIRVRVKGDLTYTSGVEEMVAKIVTAMTGTSPQLHPSKAAEGSPAAYKRDISMVKGAAHVYAYFSPGLEMLGGTSHVVEAALREGVSVTCYTFDDSGHVVSWAEYDEPEALF